MPEPRKHKFEIDCEQGDRFAAGVTSADGNDPSGCLLLYV